MGRQDVRRGGAGQDEADNLEEFVRQCKAALEPAPFVAEVMIVERRSEDGSAVLLTKLQEQNRFSACDA